MSALIIDGKAIAARRVEDIKRRVTALKAQHSVVPGLTVVLVGDDPASQVYVKGKGRLARDVGMDSRELRLPADTTAAALHHLIATLNDDPAVHGILVQLPLPAGLDATAVINTIAPDKDVDGLHPLNAGRLASGMTGLVPCTPKGCMLLLAEHRQSLAGLHAVVLGRSNLMGKPIAQLLLAADCTVTMTHSKTRDLPARCRDADIVIAAVGRPEMVRGSWIKSGASVIDVGINRIGPDHAGKTRLVGDVCFEEAVAIAGAITPVPGGVGPMTIACLLDNTLEALCRQLNLPMAQ